jgi:hypothetical protein
MKRYLLMVFDTWAMISIMLGLIVIGSIIVVPILVGIATLDINVPFFIWDKFVNSDIGMGFRVFMSITFFIAFIGTTVHYLMEELD